MTTKRSMVGALAALLVAIAMFGAGCLVGGNAAAHPAVLIGDGYVGADQATFQVGDASYGFNSSVSWTDSAGSFHDHGWPECLPKTQPVKGVRFEVAKFWAGNVGLEPVVWVDCQSFHG